MLKKNPQDSDQDDLFRPRLETIIDPRHELARLAMIIDWDGLEADVAQHYCADNGRPGGSARLMAGLCFLKDAKGLSDEEVCATWRENPYFQYFCGEEFFQHRLPVEPPSLSIFRKRIGEAGMERLLQETILAGLKTGVVTKEDMQRVNVDTTVQEKAVHFPTDVRLCHKARLELVKAAQASGIELRQSYARKSKQALFMANKYLAARQMKRGRKEIKKVRNYLGRVMRDIERAALECIAKGKAHKKYEFGCKASLASTSKSNFIVGAKAHHGRPYDGHILGRILEQIEKLTGVAPQEAHVDLGFRGHGLKDAETEIILSRQKRGITPARRKRQKRRNAIEPIIGHCKNDRKVGPRNWLRGVIGDQINAIAMAIGFNLRKILKAIFLWLLARLLYWRNIAAAQAYSV